jgi:hypothetical protein
MTNIQNEVQKIHNQYGMSEMANYKIQLLCEQYAKEYHDSEVKKLNIPAVIKSLLTDKEIEEYIWEEISIELSQIDIDTYSDGYIRYLNAVHWAKWGRDNFNGL